MFPVEEEGIPDDFPGQKVNIKELDDVLMRDVGNKIKESKKFVRFIYFFIIQTRYNDFTPCYSLY